MNKHQNLLEEGTLLHAQGVFPIKKHSPKYNSNQWVMIWNVVWLIFLIFASNKTIHQGAWDKLAGLLFFTGCILVFSLKAWAYVLPRLLYKEIIFLQKSITIKGRYHWVKDKEYLLQPDGQLVWCKQSFLNWEWYELSQQYKGQFVSIFNYSVVVDKAAIMAIAKHHQLSLLLHLGKHQTQEHINRKDNTKHAYLPAPVSYGRVFSFFFRLLFVLPLSILLVFYLPYVLCWHMWQQPTWGDSMQVLVIGVVVSIVGLLIFIFNAAAFSENNNPFFTYKGVLLLPDTIHLCYKNTSKSTIFKIIGKPTYIDYFKKQDKVILLTDEEKPIGFPVHPFTPMLPAIRKFYQIPKVYQPQAKPIPNSKEKEE